MCGALKTILVTGGNKGIGLAICEKLLSDYSDTKVFLGSRDVGRGQKAVDALLEKGSFEGRLEAIAVDVDDAASVEKAASQIGPLYAVCNNAGIGFGNSFEATLKTNFWGTKKVCDAFLPLLKKTPGSRIVNTASASGPNFVSRCQNSAHLKVFARPDTATLDELYEVAKSYETLSDYDGDAYGVSKACVNAYTYLLAKENPDVLINSMTPGYIMTDLTKGMGATKTPEYGARVPVYLLMDEETVPQLPTGRFYGSDGQRSPLDKYRDPGSPPYDGPPY